MSFTGSVSEINQAMEGMIFRPTSNFSGAAAVQITTNDRGNTGAGGALSDSDTINISVKHRQRPPGGHHHAGHNHVHGNTAAALIDAAITVTDSDSAKFASATIAITSGYVAGEDVLTFVNQNGITGSFNARDRRADAQRRRQRRELPGGAAIDHVPQHERSAQQRDPHRAIRRPRWQQRVKRPRPPVASRRRAHRRRPDRYASGRHAQ
jgi:hypothetical protein